MMALMRSRTDRKIAGVCGGIARQNGWDPTVVRLIWVALVLFAGTGVLAYLVLWVVIPEEPYALPYPAGYAQPPQAYQGGYAPPVAGPYPGGQTYQGQGAAQYPTPPYAGPAQSTESGWPVAGQDAGQGQGRGQGAANAGEPPLRG